MAVHSLTVKLGRALCGAGQRLATAESCTGGLLASTLTDVAGSSDWFEGGVVAYDNRVKMQLLGVSRATLNSHGAVSGECVQAMAQGIVCLMNTAVGLAVSGIAGPGGGSLEKPVGTVWIGWAVSGQVRAQCFHFSGDRLAVKVQSVRAALAGLLEIIKNGAQYNERRKEQERLWLQVNSDSHHD